MEENTNITSEQTVDTAAPEKTFTQDEVNELIGKRLEKAEKKWADKYSNYYSQDDLASKTEELNKQITELGNSLNVANDKAATDAESLTAKDQAIADLENKVKKYETDSVKIRIALENGIPYELANKLSGESEEQIKEDAQNMAKYLGNSRVAPMRNSDAQEQDGVLAAFRALNPNLKI